MQRILKFSERRAIEAAIPGLRREISRMEKAVDTKVEELRKLEQLLLKEDADADDQSAHQVQA